MAMKETNCEQALVISSPGRVFLRPPAGRLETRRKEVCQWGRVKVTLTNRRSHLQVSFTKTSRVRPDCTGS